MGRTWVLDTGTKGTGAQMVPLEDVGSGRPSRALRAPAGPAPAPRATEPQPKPPLKFKVVDAMTRQVVADGVGTRAAVEALEGIRSIVDVSIYAWEHKAEKWRPLTHTEKQVLWGFRGVRVPPQRRRA